MTSMMLLMIACSQEHSHDEMSERLNRVEQKLALQDKKLQRIESMETYQKNASPLCEHEQSDAYVIRKSLFQEYVENEETRPRIYPHQKDGEIVGLRLANVPEDWRACDFEDGDLLLSINDVLLRTPRTLQSIYKRKDTFSEIRVLRKRQDKEQLLRFRIVNQ